MCLVEKHRSYREDETYTSTERELSDARRRVTAAEDAIAGVTVISDMKTETARTQEYNDAVKQVAALERQLNTQRDHLQRKWRAEGSI